MKLSRLALAVVLAPNLALAAPDTSSYELPPLVITRATPLQTTAPASVRVIDREKIEASAASSLVDVLRGEAGMQVRDVIGDGSRATFSLRGFGENAVNNTLILVDGRRLNQPALAGADLSSVPLSNIERIEIIRGAGSVLYGDQAVGGVINIITRQPKASEAYIETSRGSHDLEAFRGHLSQALGGGFSTFLSGESRTGDNYRDHNNASYSNAFARLRYDHDSGHALYEYQAVDDELLYPGSISKSQRRVDRKQSTSSDWFDSKTQLHRIALQQQLHDNLNANLDYSHSDQDGVGSSWGSRYRQATRVESISPRFSGHLDSVLGRSEWLLGHDHINNDYENTLTSTEFRQTQRDWYGQWIQPLSSSLSLSVGYRESQAEDRKRGSGKSHTDNQGSSSLGLSWQAAERTRLFIKREDVLRWANVDENGYVPPGVDYLKPQTGLSWEAGAEWQDSRQRYQASLYRLDLEDELMYDSQANAGLGANINLDKTRRQGLLLEAERQLSERLSIGGQYSFTDSEYLQGNFKGNEVPWVSRHSASAHLSYQLLPGVTSYVEAVYTGARYLSSDDGHTLPREGGYTLINAALSWDYQQFNSKLRVNNLTGKQYDSHAGWNIWSGSYHYPAPEEQVQLSVGYRF